MLTKVECLAIHQKNAGRVCYIEPLAANDYRMVPKNDTDTLHGLMSAENELKAEKG